MYVYTVYQLVHNGVYLYKCQHMYEYLILAVSRSHAQLYRQLSTRIGGGAKNLCTLLCFMLQSAEGHIRRRDNSIIAPRHAPAALRAVRDTLLNYSYILRRGQLTHGHVVPPA